jgi:hypothetical protein
MKTNELKNCNTIQEISKIVNQTIVSAEVAKQFVLEEIEAASNGNELAKLFATNSGISSNEYQGSLGRSWDAIDGINGPQQTLLKIVFSIAQQYGMDVAVEIRVLIVKEIMRLHDLGKYNYKESDNAIN